MIHHISKRTSNGVTLIELLIVIAVIGVISGMFAYAFRGAQQESNNQRTRATVEKISQVIVPIYSEYANEPLGVAFTSAWDVLNSSNWTFPVAPATNRTVRIERTKLLMIRDRLRFEMPDCADDLKWTTTRIASVPTGGLGNSPDALIRRCYTLFRGEINPISPPFPSNISPALSSRAIRLMRKLSDPPGSTLNPSTFYRPKAGWETTNANAELLYLIIEDATLDGSSAIELFNSREIGDLDGDGLNEFLDAWGNPIAWLRWPAGSTDVVFSHPDPLDPQLVRNNRLALGDEPYDPFGADPCWNTPFPPEPLGVPIVISAGGDGKFGVRLQLDPIPAGEVRSGSFFSGSTSSADCRFYAALNNAPNNVSWLPIDRNFADPWYPRESSRASGRLGAVLTASEASDNITSLQGTGASL